MSHIEYPHDDHKRNVELLSIESSVPFEEVARLYEIERSRMTIGAHIKAYIPIFVMRNVRKTLGRRRILWD